MTASTRFVWRALAGALAAGVALGTVAAGGCASGGREAPLLTASATGGGAAAGALSAEASVRAAEVYAPQTRPDAPARVYDVVSSSRRSGPARVVRLSSLPDREGRWTVRTFLLADAAGVAPEPGAEPDQVVILRPAPDGGVLLLELDQPRERTRTVFTPGLMLLPPVVRGETFASPEVVVEVFREGRSTPAEKGLARAAATLVDQRATPEGVESTVRLEMAFELGRAVVRRTTELRAVATPEGPRVREEAEARVVRVGPLTLERESRTVKAVGIRD